MSDDRTSEFFDLARSIPVPGAMNSISSTAAAPGGPERKPSFHSQSTDLTSHQSQTHSAPSSGRYAGAASHHPQQQQQQSNPAHAELRDFHRTAADISRDIAGTSTLLSELTQLVRRRGLFDDESDRVNWLVLRIKSNIESLNGRLDDAGAQIARSKRRLGKNSQAGQEASNLVGQLQSDFVKATTGFKAALQQRSDRMKETSDRKRDVFGMSGDGSEGAHSLGDRVMRSDSGLALGNKPPVYGMSSSSAADGGGGGNGLDLSGGGGGLGLGGGRPGGNGGSSMPTLDLTSGMMAYARQENGGIPAGESSSQLPRPHGVAGMGGGSSAYAGASPNGMRLRHSNSEPIGGMPTYSASSSTYNQGGDPFLGDNAGGAPLTPLDIQRMEQESGNEQMMQLIPDQDYLRERADAMTTVESNIVELGTIFNKLAVMVSEHREMVQRVEDNVDDANDNINLSLGTLTDTLTNLQTNRALFMKVFAVIVVFVILFITFFA